MQQKIPNLVKRDWALGKMHLRSQLLGGCLLPNVSRFLTLYLLPCLPSRVLSFNPFIQNGELQKRDNSALARLGVLLPTLLGSVMKIVESIRWAGTKVPLAAYSDGYWEKAIALHNCNDLLNKFAS
ncbi:hypothetical protein CDG77_23910 [Nostoc sp. 'Peltigera membranacea cyanobiont' 213]|uniref:hypothetical protein n=1 Tax=unclassified Nostoc TaxID=2593658 RepID=UPI000B9F3F2F|nr:hypothetical protein [Nostoc sp. 'Peltigera membranacea cyanobiont' 213]OYD88391.1 hypothetical protein CDG77_23910 [Nostoc sp. 'Peltigera membranacea cyanobiont' 213]